jgi:hypothetical protein
MAHIKDWDDIYVDGDVIYAEHWNQLVDFLKHHHECHESDGEDAIISIDGGNA